MLATHLDPQTDLASRRPEIIARSVAWIGRESGLPPGPAVVDLGCGPGLYASRLAELGYQVAGVDFPPSSIAYARRYALDHQLKIDYRCQDYLSLADESAFDAALLIYGDFCPLSPDQRRKLLANVHRLLKPGGWFVLDVSRHKPAPAARSKTGWVAFPGGFWRPGPHLVLEQAFAYPEQALQMDQYAVLEESGVLTVYRIWPQGSPSQSITAELRSGHLEVVSLWGDLTGLPDDEAEDWIGIVAQKFHPL